MFNFYGCLAVSVIPAWKGFVEIGISVRAIIELDYVFSAHGFEVCNAVDWNSG